MKENKKVKSMTTDFQRILREAQKLWMEYDEVVAVGKGRLEGRDCIDVLVTSKNARIERLIPAEFKKIPVVLRESGGPITAQ